MIELATESPEETAAVGSALAEAADSGAGAFVSLSGPLGAGKTVLVKGIAEGLGIDPVGVSSPTFVLANRYEGYEGGSVLVHADFYRIESEGELLAAGFLDWLEPGAIVVAEWGDRFPDALPQVRLELRIERRGETGRRIAARARGESAQGALDRLEAAWGARAQHGRSQHDRSQKDERGS